VLYALRRGVGDASDGIEEIQSNLRRMLRGGERSADWVAFTPPEFDKLVQRAMERVMKLLDLPRRSDIEALNKNLERVASALEGLERGRRPVPEESEPESSA
jgi:hypothetical protein